MPLFNEKLKCQLGRSIVVAMAAFGMVSPVYGQGVEGFLYSGGSFSTINVPGSIWTVASGINSSGQIVGWFSTGSGFLDTNGSFSIISFADSTINPWGINSSGKVVGTYFPSNAANLGFSYFNGSFSCCFHGIYDAYQGVSLTGINDRGQIVGSGYDDNAGRRVNFLDTNGSFSTINAPGDLLGVNNQDQFVGIYHSGGQALGFLDTNGVITTISVPGSIATEAHSINNFGQIVGTYWTSSGEQLGFKYNDSTGVFSTISAPGSDLTVVYGINDLDQIVGYFSPAPSPTPGAGLLGLGFLILSGLMTKARGFLRGKSRERCNRGVCPSC